jgi:hypothetical protein
MNYHVSVQLKMKLNYLSVLLEVGDSFGPAFIYVQ